MLGLERRQLPFHRAGFNVVQFDIPGMGQSGGPRAGCTTADIFRAWQDTLAFAGREFGGPLYLMGVAEDGVTCYYAGSAPLAAMAATSAACDANARVKADANWSGLIRPNAGTPNRPPHSLSNGFSSASGAKTWVGWCMRTLPPVCASKLPSRTAQINALAPVCAAAFVGMTGTGRAFWRAPACASDMIISPPQAIVEARFGVPRQLFALRPTFTF